jgi:hypothetical protein
MNFKPRPLSVASSVGAIVISTFWVWIEWDGIELLGAQGHAVSWVQFVRLAFWVGSLAFSIWSGIESGRINRQERIQRSEDSPLEKNR